MLSKSAVSFIIYVTLCVTSVTFFTVMVYLTSDVFRHPSEVQTREYKQ
jgi:cell division protein FtsL